MKKFFLVLPLIFALLFSGCSMVKDKNKAGLQIITNNESVLIFLNNQYIDKSPYINKSLQPNEYILRLEPEDRSLSAYEVPITLRKGLLTVVTWKPGASPETSGGVIYELEPIDNKKIAEVSFISFPDNTIIQFDKKEKQFSPLIITDLEPGHHEFEANLPSYESQKHTINLVAGHRLNINLKLAKVTTETETKPSPTDLPNPPETKKDALESSPSAKISREEFLNNSNNQSNQAIVGNRIKILPTNFYMNGEEVLRVRESSSANSKELGFAQVGQEYAYLDEENNGWYKIKFNQQEGYVSKQFCQLITD